MEKAEGYQKSMEDLEISSSYPPWIELLDSLIEVIIEKLPLVDYIRFGIICKRWHSIQKEHRLRYSPKPPPIAPSVVLVNFNYNRNESNWENDKQLLLHLPFEQKKYHLPLPFLSTMSIHDFCCGWILTHHWPCPNNSPNLFKIYNPVTGVIIDLPLFSYRNYIRNGSMSAPPTDPNCCIIVSSYHDIFVLRLGDLVWEEVQVTNDLDVYAFSQSVYVKGKFYRTSCLTQKFLYIVDPFLPKPAEQILELDIEEMIEYNELDAKYKKLFVIDGQLFLVISVCGNVYDEIKIGFHVFRADFITKRWTRVTSLGDYSMFLSTDNVMCLRLNSVQGFEKNMIYFSELYFVEDSSLPQGIYGFRISLMTFDMDSQEIAEGPTLLYDEYDFDVMRTFMYFWFSPTI